MHEPRRLFLHIGPPKTGTSAIQHAMRGLDAPGLLYPTVGLWPDGSHHNLVFALIPELARPDRAAVAPEALLGELRAQAEAHPARDLLISSEALAIGAPVVVRFLDILLQALRPMGFAPQVILACRDPLARAASAYNQQVKDPLPGLATPPDVFLRRRAPLLRMVPLIDALQGAGLPISVLNYHPAATLVPRFLAVLGLGEGADAAAPAAWRNISIATKGLVALMVLNGLKPEPALRRAYFDAVRRCRGIYAPSRMIFGAEVAAWAEATHFAADRAALAARLGIVLPAPPKAPPKAPPEAPPEAPGAAAGAAAGEFFVTPGEMAELEAAIRGTGPLDDALLRGIESWVRDRPRTPDPPGPPRPAPRRPG